MKLIRKRGNAEKEIQLNGELSGKKTRTDPSPEGIQMHSLRRMEEDDSSKQRTAAVAELIDKHGGRVCTELWRN